MSPNPNRPAPGSVIRVEPIRELKDIKTIKKLLANKPRDLALFTLGINTALRASDLLAITLGQVRGLQVGESFPVREKKTGKVRTITLNPTVHDALQPWLKEIADLPNDNPIFDNGRNIGKSITVPYLNNLVKGWCRTINLKGNYGSHTLRKTFGYIHWTIHRTHLAILVELYNHSSVKETMKYLCIEDPHIRDALLKEI